MGKCYTVKLPKIDKLAKSRRLRQSERLTDFVTRTEHFAIPHLKLKKQDKFRGINEKRIKKNITNNKKKKEIKVDHNDDQINS